MILVVDNYDSFTHNLVDLLERLGARCVVVRHDEASLDELAGRGADAFVVSPGPCSPAESGVSLELCRAAARGELSLPLLGVCLGHQAIAAACGGRVVRAERPVHGKTSVVRHAGTGMFAGLPAAFEAARYNSLVVERAGLPAALEVTAWTDAGEIMGLRHVERPIEGVQFHPESFMTPLGPALLGAWLRGVEAGRA